MSLRSLRLTALASALSLLAGAACASATDAPEDVAESDEALIEKKSLGMTDVTILYPLPKSADFFDDMLGPSSEGSKGELLPGDLFAQLLPIDSPPMVDHRGREHDPQRKLLADFEEGFSMLRVVGVRLDPCFGESTNFDASTCVSTVRLTAQFFVPDSLHQGSPRPDGRSSIHLIYRLTRQEFTTLAKAMLELRKQTGLPLQKGLMGTTRGVHPTLQEQGLRGAYATALKDLLLEHIGVENLTEVAFCVQDRFAHVGGGYGGNRQENSRWVFGRHEVRRGQLVPMPIQTLDYTGLQTVDTMPANQDRKDSVIVQPPPRTPDDIFPAFNGSDANKAAEARAAAVRLQNPVSYATNALDCASCHMAKQAAPQAKLDFRSYTFRLDHTHDALGPFRMFGYDVAANPIVTGRVVNETVVVLDYVNKVVMR